MIFCTSHLEEQITIVTHAAYTVDINYIICIMFTENFTSKPNLVIMGKGPKTLRGDVFQNELIGLIN